jgi:hypothetical protein
MGDEAASLNNAEGNGAVVNGVNPEAQPVPDPKANGGDQPLPQEGLTKDEIVSIFAGLSTEKGRLQKAAEEARLAKDTYLNKAKELDDKILNGLKDDPAKLSLQELQIKTRNEVEALREKQIEFNTARDAFDKDKSEYEAWKFDKSLNAIAQKHKVPIEILKKTGITDTETLDRVAAYIKPTVQPETKPVDSGKGNGGVSDKEWLKLFSKGLVPASTENIKRAKSIMSKE